MRKSTPLAAAILSTMASVVALAGPATAGPAASVIVPEQLQITITPLSNTPGLPSGPVSALLTCDPVGGSHRYAERACADLEAAKGDIAAVAPQPGAACLAVWRPVQISVTGRWRGQAIDFSQTQPEISCARVSHGYIFMI